MKDVVAQQTASTSMSGTTGGSSSSTVQLQLSGGTITAAGVASTSTGTLLKVAWVFIIRRLLLKSVAVGSSRKILHLDPSFP